MVRTGWWVVVLVACGGSERAAVDATPLDTAVDAPIDSYPEPPCTSTAPPGVVSVDIRYPTPPSVRVFFHGPTGALVGMGNGSSSATLPPCSSVTIVENDPAQGIATITSVQPGDTIVWGGSAPSLDLDAWTVRVDFPPTGRPVEFYGGYDPLCHFTATTSPAIGSLVEECLRTGTKTFELLAIDSLNGTPVGFATATIQLPTTPIADPPSATIAAWRTDFQSIAMAVTNAPSGLATRLVGLAPVNDGLSMTLLSASSTPAAIPFPPFGESAYRITTLAAADPSTESIAAADIVATPLADSTLDVATELPFRITSLAATGGTRPIVTWTTAAPATNADYAFVYVELDQAPYTLVAYVDPSRNSVRFPELPASVMPTGALRRVILGIEETSIVNGYSQLRLAPQRTYEKTGIRYPAALRIRRANRSIAFN